MSRGEEDAMSQMVSVDQIVIEDRVRKDLGDIEGLAESIARLGQLQPIGIDTANRLLFGERRIAALKHLGRAEVRAEVFTDLDTALARLQAERDENTARKEFTPEEMIRQGKRLEPLEREAAAARKREGQRRGPVVRDARRKGLDLEETFTASSQPPSKEGVRERLGAAFGVSGITYRRAQTVIDAADKEPSLRSLVDEMNATGNVNSSYNKMLLATGRGGREPKTSDESSTKPSSSKKKALPPKRPKVLALEGFETYIESRLEAFLDVAHALFEIREQRLFTEQYGEFHRYLRKRWGVNFQMGRAVTCALDAFGFVQAFGGKDNDHAR